MKRIRTLIESMEKRKISRENIDLMN